MATAHRDTSSSDDTHPEAPKNKTRAPRGGGTVFAGKSHGRDCYIAKITVTGTDGKKFEVRGVGATRQQAVERRTANLAKRLGSTAITSTPRVHSISTYMPIWLASQPPHKMKEQSKRQHENNLNKWVIPYLDQPLSRLTRQELEDHFNSVMPTKLGAGPFARVNAHKSLRALLNHAVGREVITRNPLTGIKFEGVCPGFG